MNANAHIDRPTRRSERLSPRRADGLDVAAEVRPAIVARRLRRVEALGMNLDLGSVDCFLNEVEDALVRRRRTRIFYHNLHTLYLYYRDNSLRRHYQRAVVMADGMPLIWLLRIMGTAARREDRVTWVDLIWPLLERARARGWRVFYVGGSEPVITAGLAAIRERLPALEIDGHHGYFDDAVDPSISPLVQRINAFKPDLCIVGIGSPRQERWITTCQAGIAAPVIMASGSCIEYIADHVKTPPRWMGRWGIEWSYRLWRDPRRFAHRYLVEPWLLMALMCRYWLRSATGCVRRSHEGSPRRRDRVAR